SHPRTAPGGWGTPPRMVVYSFQGGYTAIRWPDQPYSAVSNWPATWGRVDVGVRPTGGGRAGGPLPRLAPRRLPGRPRPLGHRAGGRPRTGPAAALPGAGLRPLVPRLPTPADLVLAELWQPGPTGPVPAAPPGRLVAGPPMGDEPAITRSGGCRRGDLNPTPYPGTRPQPAQARAVSCRLGVAAVMRQPRLSSSTRCRGEGVRGWRAGRCPWRAAQPPTRVVGGWERVGHGVASLGSCGTMPLVVLRV